MKKITISIAACLLLALMVAFAASAAEGDLASGSCGESGSAVTWSLNKSTGHLTISGSGSMKDWSKLAVSGDTAAPWRAYADSIKTAEVKGITELGTYTFSTLKKLTSVTLDDTIKSLPAGAFFECEALQSVKLPAGLTEIGDAVFSGCRSLGSISIPETVAKIASDALYGCGSLSEIEVASGNNVFRSEGNSLIEKTTATLLRGPNDGSIPESVTEIAQGAFSGCRDLKSAVIPDSVKKIGKSIYEGCSSLESLTLPFVGDIRVAPGAQDDRDKINGRLAYLFGDSQIPGTLKSVVITDAEVLEAEAFVNCGSLEAVVLPDKLQIIENGAFFGCSALAQISLPSALTDIGMAAFTGCSALKELSIPDNVKTIGETAFLGCTSLKTLSVGASLAELGAGAFYSCPKLESLSVSDKNTVFYSESNCIIKREGKAVVLGCKNSVLPSDILAVGNGAFRNCSGLTEIAFPQGMTYIGESAFEGCSGLLALELPTSLTEVGAYAFAECSSLVTVKAPAGISYGDSVFKNCISMQSEDMPTYERPAEDVGCGGCSSLSVYHLFALIALAATMCFAVELKKH